MQVADTTAVWADFVHIRTVKGRKVCEMIIEAPLEDLLEILKRLGNPVGADCISVAIAPIDPKAVKAALDVRPVTKPSEAPAPSGSKPFSSLPLSQQAALRCQDGSFIKFMQEISPEVIRAGWDVAEEVRAFCGINSRSELDDAPMDSARMRWRQLEERYQTWLTDQRYGGLRHG